MIAGLEKPMSRVEMMEEVEWFLDADVHPLQIAVQLQRRPNSIYQNAIRAGNVRVRRAFNPFSSGSLPR